MKKYLKKSLPQGVPPTADTIFPQTESLPNSTLSHVDDFQDGSLAMKMQARMSERFPDADELQSGSGRALELPDEFRSSLESHFGHSLDGVQFRESGDAASIGAKAFARGNEIHFAPGQFHPETAAGRKMIGHEVSHLQQQSGGQTSGNGVVLDESLERQADRDGDAVSGLYGDTQARSAPVTPMPTASFDAAPAQGWGIQLPWKKKGTGQHEALTEAARKKASQYVSDQSKNADNANQAAYQSAAAAGELDDAKSFEYGSRFNDVGKHSVPGMLAQMEVKKTDAFINQTHHGDMQFLHSMDTSNGDTRENMRKAQRYARFASDVYQNREDEHGTKLQDQNMLSYVLQQNGNDKSGKKDPFQEMMMSTMLAPEKLKELDKQMAKDPAMQNLSPAQRRAQRTERLRAAAEEGQGKVAEAEQKYANKNFFQKMLAGGKEKYMKKKTGLSEYARNTVGNFFTNGDESLDAGKVALGSASHMIEDSYAGSHAIRSDNLFLGTSRATDLSETGDEIADKSTDVIASADYNQQSNLPFIGRHEKGDKLFTDYNDAEANIDETRGGSLARDAAAQYMAMNVRMKHSGGTENYDAEGGIGDFVGSVLKADSNVNTVNTPGGVTATGSAYAKKVGGANRAENKAADAFRKNTKGMAENKHTTARQRAETYEEQIPNVLKLAHSAKSETSEHYKKQGNEMLVNIQSMIQQIQKAGEKEPLSEGYQHTLDQLLKQADRLSKGLRG